MHQAWHSWQRSHWLWIAAGVLAGSFVIIVVAGLLSPSPSDSPPVNAGSAQAEFFNVVIFGVDDLLNGAPAVEAVWIGTFELVGKNGVLLGLPPTFQLTNQQSLEQAFAWAPDLGLDPAVVSALETTLNLQIDNVVVMDEICFQASLDFIGGIPMENGRTLNGAAALALQKLSANDPWMALEVQSRILSNASQRLAQLGQTPDLSPLLELTPGHCWLTMNDEAAVELILRMLPLSEDGIRVDTLVDVE
jgi:hypothetical protein